ncbi:MULTISPECIES: MarR family winged helix-turn-helix transcriptional regulator [unclassified Xanthobacter]|uniref:MarR family winged helix-turn-helix transcriptional regulator n=1 Tax=unclassified Xanthobacter TaxID=2623496 RepID=UPI001EE00C18|nr:MULTISPECIES: MarR family transcriptional regulator [unclassified Xanthobacter]
MAETPIGFLIVDAARLYRARIDRAFTQAGLGLTAGEARTLAYVNEHSGLRQNALAVKMNVEPMTLVGFLDGLERLGLVVRETDATDRRAKIVRLTDAAQPYLEGVLAAATAARAEALAGFSDADQAQLRAFLIQVRANLARCREEGARDDGSKSEE